MDEYFEGDYEEDEEEYDKMSDRAYEIFRKLHDVY